MPQVLTRDFGWLDYDDASELTFPAGVPGFETEKRFILIEKDTLAPMVFLQSLATPAVCFLTAPVQLVDPGYQIGITEEDQNRVGINNDPGERGRLDDVLVLVILTANRLSANPSPANQSSDEQSPAVPKCTANLLAPVVVNLRNKTGVQAVRADARYSHQHPLPEAPLCL